MRDVFLEVSSDCSLLPNMLSELMLVALCLSCSPTPGDVAPGSCLLVCLGRVGRMGWGSSNVHGAIGVGLSCH